MEEVLAVMVVLPAAPEGMVMPVLKAPVAVVRNWNVAEPTITVPVVEALNPVPETVTADPAGPVPGLTATCAAGAPAAAGCTPDRASPVPRKTATTNVLSIRNKAPIPS